MTPAAQQLAILVGEALLVAGVTLLLFRLRRPLGLIPLAVFVGSNQYLQTVLGSTHYISFGDDRLISPGSAVLFPSVLFAVLLIYLKDGVPRARALIWGIVLSNFTLTAFSYVTSLQIRTGNVVNLLGVPEAVFQVSPRVFFAGTSVLLLDALLTLIVYELLFIRLGWLPAIARLPLALVVVLVFDAFAFVGIAFAGHPSFLEILENQLISKLCAGAFYGLILFAYLSQIDPEPDPTEDDAAHRRGVFAIFTYRERYQTVIDALTELRKTDEALRESEERYRDLFENSYDLIQAVAPDGSFVYVNSAWKDALGYDDDEVARLNVFDVIHPRSRNQCRKLFGRILGGESLRLIETELVTKDGRAVTVEGSASCRFEAGEPVMTRGIFRDVTERKAIERLKDQFISTVSHELRTPMTSIYGSLRLLHATSMGELPAKAARMVDVAQRNAARLTRLINNLLDFQKIRAGLMVLELEPHDLGDLVAQAVEEHHGYADGFGVALELAGHVPEVQVRVDQDWLKQVMANLLSNAVKLSPRGDTVTVTMERRGRGARVSVTDRGPGIPAAFRPKIFQPFSRAQPGPGGPTGGTGLGLSIVKAVVEEMDGTIGFETEDGAGTTFYFDLPLCREA